MDELWQKLQELLLEYSGRILAAALVLGFGWLVLRLFVAALRRFLTRSRIDPTFFSFLINSARALILTVLILVALQQLGVQITSVLALLGAFGVAIALALQTTLANFACGLLLLAFRMVHIDDWIEVGGIRGRITEMMPLHVVLVTADNQRVTVPNSVLTNGPMCNHSSLPLRRAQWTIPLAAEDNLAGAKEAIKALLVADARILKDHAPQVFVQDWLADQRTLVVQVWTATGDHHAVQQELLERLGEAVESLRKQ
jgi:small conductance mechanosensitive channel